MPKLKKNRGVSTSANNQPQDPGADGPTELEKKLKAFQTMSAQLDEVLPELKEKLKELNSVEGSIRLAGLKAAEQPAKTEEPEEIEIPEDPELPARPGDEFAGLMEGSAFDAALRELSSGSEGTIEFRRIDAKGREALMGTYPIDEWGASLEKCAEKYGGGEYKIILRDASGHYKGVGTRYFDEVRYPRPLPGQVIQSAAPQQPDISEVLKTVQAAQEKQQDRIIGLFQTLLANNQAQQKPAAPVDPLSELERFAKIKAILEPPKSNPLQDVASIIGMFNKGVQAGQSLTPAAEPRAEGNFMDILSAFAPALIPLVGKFIQPAPGRSPLSEGLTELQRKAAEAERAEAGQPQPQPAEPQAQLSHQPTPAAAVQVGAPAAQPQQQLPVQEKKEMNLTAQIALRMYKGPLLSMAQSNFKAEDAAKAIIALVPGDYLKNCLTLTALADRLAICEEYIPELAQYREWVGKVLDAGKDQLTLYFQEQAEYEALEEQQRAEEENLGREDQPKNLEASTDKPAEEVDKK